MCLGSPPKKPLPIDSVVTLEGPDFISLMLEQRIRKMIIRQASREWHAWCEVALSLEDWETLSAQLGDRVEILSVDGKPAIRIATAVGFLHIFGDVNLKAYDMRLLKGRCF